MKTFFYSLFFPIFLISCQGNNATNKIATTDTTSKLIPQSSDTFLTVKDTLTNNPTNQKTILALTSNAVQLVDAITGSTKEIGFGMLYGQLIPIINRIVDGEPNSVGINAECGAGPLKMATWLNGLTLVFQEKKTGSGDWFFAGWFAGPPTGNGAKLTTMAGVGVGSTLEELESAYVTTVTRTTLGQEFSVKSGFYGVLSGTGKNATIEVMWSGTSCNFR